MNDLLTFFADSVRRAPQGYILVGLVLLGLIRIWPAMSKQAIEARAQLRKEKRDDLKTCQQRLDDADARIDELHEAFTNLKIELSGTVAAYRILDLAEEARDPTSLHLAQARAVLSTAFTIAPSTGALKGRPQ